MPFVTCEPSCEWRTCSWPIGVSGWRSRHMDQDGGPDFTVTVRGAGSFNLEVTRSRLASDHSSIGGSMMAKLRQLPPSVPNALLIAVAAESPEQLDVAAASRALRARADAKDEPFFDRRGFAGSRGFYERFLRLGVVMVWSERAAGDARAAAWTNRSARLAVPERGVRACLAALRAD